MAPQFALPTILSLGLLLGSSVLAGQDLPRLSRGVDVHHGAARGAAKAAGDTINLMSFQGDPTNGPGEPLFLGDFENAAGNPAWNGWTSVDETYQGDTHWQVSNFNQPDPANLAAWCGDINLPSCDDSLDPSGGYGNNWTDILGFHFDAAHPAEPTTLRVTADVLIDTEPGYDFFSVSRRDPDSRYFTWLEFWDGNDPITLDVATTFLPAEYDGGRASIYLLFQSDGAWSDEDCMWPTAGAVQVDDLTVEVTNGAYLNTWSTDFQDGTFGPWVPESLPGVGDFAKIWTGLQDLDPCRDNFSPQVAFIDDGVVVPGLEGTQCINWCYGPQGYIVNTTGGLAGPSLHHQNSVYSPVMPWPDPSYDGIEFRFDAFVHEDLSFDAPGMFFVWGVRSADTDGDGGFGVHDITAQPWESRGFLYYGGPFYDIFGDDVTDLMVPGRDQVQVMMGTYELGWVFGRDGHDGYPAPYFDNVRVKVYPHLGPAIVAREIDLAQDNFPERGSIDFDDLGSHGVRFDMARNIAPATDMRNDPGDSLVFDAASIRTGAELVGVPKLVYKVFTNPVFDPYRGAFPTEGEVDCLDAVDTGQYYGPPLERWVVDLPDSNFLFPGDVVHYFIEATDAVGGSDLITATLPADTTGFSVPPDFPVSYDPVFTMRCLPTILGDGFGGHEVPPVLFWQDFDDPTASVTWNQLWRNSQQAMGLTYDVYRTQGPASGVGNGLGGRALSHLPLEHYREIFYSSGALARYTLGDGDFQGDPGNDLQVLDAWLHLGDRDLFLCGDNLVNDLALGTGGAGLIFAENMMGVSLVGPDLQPFIQNQASPLVRFEEGGPVFQNVAEALLFGGCPTQNMFDAVEVLNPATRLGQFTDPSGLAGLYTFSAATLNLPGPAPTSRVVSLPYDLASIRTPAGAKAGAPLAVREQMLLDLLGFFGVPWAYQPAETPGALVFTARNHPNPFNPVTKIVYTVPRAGHLSLKVYDIRGMLVRTLVDGHAPAGADQVAVWDGRDMNGAGVSSGVYFYEARTGGEVKVGKMALVK